MNPDDKALPMIETPVWTYEEYVEMWESRVTDPEAIAQGPLSPEHFALAVSFIRWQPKKKR